MRTKVNIIKGDITAIPAEAVVNAANSKLRRGSGVCGAIYAAAGPALEIDTLALHAKIGLVTTGKAVVTPSHDLLAKNGAKVIVHAVGPIYKDNGANGEAELLRRAYISSLQVASLAGAKSISFPCISTGVYGFPPEKAAVIALDAIMEYSIRTSVFDAINIVCFLDSDMNLYLDAQANFFGTTIPHTLTVDRYVTMPEPTDTPSDSILGIHLD